MGIGSVIPRRNLGSKKDVSKKSESMRVQYRKLLSAIKSEIVSVEYGIRDAKELNDPNQIEKLRERRAALAAQATQQFRFKS